MRDCLRDPVPQVFEGAALLRSAVDAHFRGESDKALQLFAQANMAEIREWTESLWGASSPYIKRQVSLDAPPLARDPQVSGARMPTRSIVRELHLRDGYRCRFCGIPVIRAEVRRRIHKEYPSAVPWGSRNIDQHAAFQAMWAQYDHVIPYTRGGDSSLENLVVACAPCNFGRMESLVSEVALSDPRLRAPISSEWTGLEEFR